MRTKLSLTCLAGLLPLLDPSIVSCPVGRKPWRTLVSWVVMLGWWWVLPREARMGLLVGGLQAQMTGLIKDHGRSLHVTIGWCCWGWRQVFW